MRIEVIRRGGLAGVTVRGAVDTADLAPSVASEAEAALQSLPFGRPSAPPRHPDSFQYEIIAPSAGSRQSAVVDEAEVPEGLRPAVEAALARGELG